MISSDAVHRNIGTSKTMQWQIIDTRSIGPLDCAAASSFVSSYVLRIGVDIEISEGTWESEHAAYVWSSESMTG